MLVESPTLLGTFEQERVQCTRDCSNVTQCMHTVHSRALCIYLNILSIYLNL